MQFESRRSTVHSTKGMAASTQPLASAVAIKILEAGGNAADASVAMAAAMGLTEPMMTGIGGDAFCLYYDSKTKKVSGFNGSGKSPREATFAEAKAETTEPHLPISSGYAITVPGAPAAWVDIVERYGSGKLSLAQILAPSIELAKAGFGVSEITHLMWKGQEARLKSTANGGEQLLVDGKAPEHGQLWTNEALAAVYEKLATQGKRGFYEGPIAEEIVAAARRSGGKLSLDDLRQHASLEVEPVTIAVNEEVTLHELPPNNHGLVALIATGIFNKITAGKDLKLNSAEYIHALAESLKFAFKDADHYIGDPEAVDLDPKALLSDKFISSRAALFSASKVNEEYEHGVIDPANKSDTSYFTVADKDGNACSFIASVYYPFGSCIVPQGLGFPLHNRGCNFNLREGAHNAYGPGKRPYHTIIPAMLTRGTELYASYGVMGAFMQPQGHLQVALNLTKFGQSAQQALDTPRVCIAPSPDNGSIPSTAKIIVQLEDGIDPAVAKELEALGHTVKFVKGQARSVFGRGQVIQYEKQQGKLVYHAGSDPRGDGQAIPEI